MRVPFLDRSLVEVVESLPSSFKLRRGIRKVIHKRAMGEVLPRRIIHRKERGFQDPGRSLAARPRARQLRV